MQEKSKNITNNKRNIVKPELDLVDFRRGLGIILPIFSLPSKYGIGTLGKEAYNFCDFLEESAIRYWQLLPIGPTSYGDSPYQSFSSAAGNPYFIDLDILCQEGLLKEEEASSINFGSEEEFIDYSLIYNHRYKLLYRAYERFMTDDNNKLILGKFLKKNIDWLEDYSLFQTLKSYHFDIAWTEWDKPYRDRDRIAIKKFKDKNKEEIFFQIFMQYQFFKQWESLRSYAKSKGISLIGDIPIYVAHDSVDVWANRELFKLDSKGKPTFVAGAPPDAFTSDGQRWGNPIYNWEIMEKDDFSFWENRLKANLKLFDIIRLDHFIGFQHYWSVPFEDETAANGTWEEGPGFKLFKKLQDKLGPLPIIVEDLGVLNDKVIELRDRTGFVGMKPLQFAFGGGPDSDYLPHNLKKRSSVYTGSHDSDTLRCWWEDMNPGLRCLVSEYLAINEDEGPRWGLIRAASSTVADICIFQMQDILWKGKEARMNLPGTIGGNWKWRLLPGYAHASIMKKLKMLANIYGR